MTEEKYKPSIYIVSGGAGASGEQLVHTVLAQYPEDIVQVTTVGSVRRQEQVADVLQKARDKNALVIFTLVDPELHNYLVNAAQEMQVVALDMMGPVIEWITQKVGTAPQGHPGLYRQLHRDYFDRIAAIDFAMTHDDGKNIEGWDQAEAVLVGVSRSGKTPLSLYLAVLGWKIANYPLVPQLPIPEKLFSLDPKRVIGLTIEPGQLLQYRMHRQSQLGVSKMSAYVQPQAVFEEVEEALKVFRRGRFTVIDMTDKTIEQGADEIVRHLSKQASISS
jgi:[pyruvate, water dikinase]-phosphate phosphotransferase / [pyruvate, water dikinase] kinase